MIRFLRDEEEEKIRKVLQNALDACPTLNKQMRKRLEHRIHELTISLGTGMRKGEQYGLQRPDVDLERRRISVRETENGEVRHIPMNDDVYGAFKALLATGKLPSERFYVLMGCPRCMRAFPKVLAETQEAVRETPCLYYGAVICYAIAPATDITADATSNSTSSHGTIDIDGIPMRFDFPSAGRHDYN